MGGGKGGVHDEGNTRSVLFLPCEEALDLSSPWAPGHQSYNNFHASHQFPRFFPTNALNSYSHTKIRPVCQALPPLFRGSHICQGYSTYKPYSLNPMLLSPTIPIFVSHSSRSCRLQLLSEFQTFLLSA